MELYIGVGKQPSGHSEHLMGAEPVQTMQSLLIVKSRPTLSAPNSQQAWSIGSDSGTRARQQTVPCAVKAPKPLSRRRNASNHLTGTHADATLAGVLTTIGLAFRAAERSMRCHWGEAGCQTGP